MTARAEVDRQPALLFRDVGQAPSSVQHQPGWNASQVAERAVAPTSAKENMAASKVVNASVAAPAPQIDTSGEPRQDPQ